MARTRVDELSSLRIRERDSSAVDVVSPEKALLDGAPVGYPRSFSGGQMSAANSLSKRFTHMPLKVSRLSL